MPIDYSKWKSIEVSDDEDDTHPNIDTPSLFRWRHSARVERMEEEKKKREQLQKEVKENEKNLDILKEKMAKCESSDSAIDSLKKELEKLEVEKKELEKKESEFEKEEKLRPWNVDTISKDNWSKTIINKQEKSSKVELSDEEKSVRQRQHTKKYEKDMEKFGMLRKWDDSRQFLQENLHLVCEETANFLVIWCINLEMEGKRQLMEHVAHQSIVMQFILELAKQLDVDPRGCVSSFFARIRHADKQYSEAFNDELQAFRTRIINRAEQKMEEIRKEVEEEERQERLGPGGLDPVEVYESLPKELQECFDKKDIPMLQEVLTKMPEDQARGYLQKCIDSGLWVPGGGDTDCENKGAAAAADPTPPADTTPPPETPESS